MLQPLVQMTCLEILGISTLDHHRYAQLALLGRLIFPWHSLGLGCSKGWMGNGGFSSKLSKSLELVKQMLNS
jgi:hypothetical protein